MLVVEDLTCKPAGQAAVEGVSFEAQPGEVVAVVGPNGAGKTTLARCVALLLAPERGAIWVGGQRLRGEPWTATRAGLAVVLKGRRVFPNLSVRDNLHASPLAGARARDVR